MRIDINDLRNKAAAVLLALIMSAMPLISGCGASETPEPVIPDTESAEPQNTPDTSGTNSLNTETETDTDIPGTEDTADTAEPQDDTDTDPVPEQPKKERLTPGLFTISESEHLELYAPGFGILFLGGDRYGVSWTNSSLIIENEKCDLIYSDRTLEFTYRGKKYTALFDSLLPYAYDSEAGGIGNYAKTADKYVSLYRDGSGIYKTDGVANVIYWGRYADSEEIYMILGSSLGSMIIDNENGKLRFEINGEPHDGYKRSTAEQLGMVFGARDTAPGVTASDPEAVYGNTGLQFKEVTGFRLGPASGEALSYNNRIRFYPTNEEGTAGFGIFLFQGKILGLSFRDGVLTLNKQDCDYTLSEDRSELVIHYLSSDYSFRSESVSQTGALDGLGYVIKGELVCVDSQDRETGVSAEFREDGTCVFTGSELECHYGFVPETNQAYILTGSSVRYEIVSYASGVLEVTDSGKTYRFMPEDMVPSDDTDITDTKDPETLPPDTADSDTEPYESDTAADTEPEPPQVQNYIITGYWMSSEGMYYVDYGDLRIPVPENFEYDVAYDGNPLFISPEGCAIKFTITEDPDGNFYSITQDSYYNEYSAYYPGFRGIYNFETGWIDGVEAKAVKYGVTFYESSGNYDATIIHLILYSNGYTYSVTYTDTYGSYGDIYVRAINSIDYRYN